MAPIAEKALDENRWKAVRKLDSESLGFSLDNIINAPYRALTVEEILRF